MSWPRTSAGRNGSGGARRNTALTASSSGKRGARSRYWRITARLRRREHDQPGRDRRPDRVQRELELRNHAEIAAAATDCPEQFRLALPAMPWPPPRTASGNPCVHAKPTAAITSALPAQRASKAGRRSIIAFQIRRASS
jgi:hypothetical protein